MMHDLTTPSGVRRGAVMRSGVWLYALIVAVALLSSACKTDLGLDDKRFACELESDCAPGYTCFGPETGQKECIRNEVLRDVTSLDDMSEMDSSPDTGSTDGDAEIDGRADAADTATPCTAECAPNEICCGSVCTNAERDPFHCGTCDNACVANTTCVSGECVEDTCTRFELESLTPDPGGFISPKELSWTLTFSCPLSEASLESGVSVHGTLSGVLEHSVAVEGKTVTLSVPRAVRGERLALYLTGVESDVLDVLEPQAFEHYFVNGGRSNGKFGAPLPVATGLLAVHDIATADLDDDGRLEIMTLTEDELVVTSWNRDTGIGTTGFTAPVSAALQLVVADLDGDRDEDVWIVRDRQVDTVLVNETEPGSTLSLVPRDFVAMPNDVRVAATGDIDLDGLPDAALIFSTSPGDRSLAVWRNEGRMSGELEFEHALAPVPGYELAGADIGNIVPDGDRGAVFVATHDPDDETRYLHAFVWNQTELRDRPVMQGSLGQAMTVSDIELLDRDVPWLFVGMQFADSARGLFAPLLAGPLDALVSGPGIVPCRAELEPLKSLGEPADLRGDRSLGLATRAPTGQLRLLGDIDACEFEPNYTDAGTTALDISQAIAGDFANDGAVDLLVADATGVYVLPGNDTLRLLSAAPPAGGLLDATPTSLVFELDRPVTIGDPLWPGNTFLTVRGEQSGVHPTTLSSTDGNTLTFDFDADGPPFIAGERIHVTVRRRGGDALTGPVRDPLVWTWRMGGEPADLGAMTVGLSFPRTPPTSPEQLTTAIVALFDGDSRPDVAFGRADSSEIITVLNDGTELATASSLVEPDRQAREYTIAVDVDPLIDGSAPDGDLDAVVGDIVLMPAVLVNDGTGRLTHQMWAEQGDLNIDDVGDIDGDGLVDVVLGGSWFSMADPQSPFIVPPDVATGNAVLVDVDSNRRYELVVHGTDDATNLISVFGPGAPGSSTRFDENRQTLKLAPLIPPVNRPLLDIVAADLDGDRDDDVAVLTHYDGEAVCLLLENTDGRLALASRPPIAHAVDGELLLGRLAAADFDGDGAIELAVSNLQPGGAGSSIVVYDIDNGGAPLSDIREAGSFMTDVAAKRLIPTDWNGDDVIDLVVSGETRGEVRLGAPK